MITRACDYLHVNEALQTLVYCSTRHTALHSHILRGDAGVMHYYLENFFIEIVYFFHIRDWLLLNGLIMFIVQN